MNLYINFIKNVLEDLGFEYPSVSYENYLPPLNNSNFQYKKVAIAPGSKFDDHRWPYYDDLASLFRLNGFQIVWLGSADEEITIAKFAHANETALIGASFQEVEICLKQVSFVVTNDTGFLHLAVLMGINCVTLAGPKFSQRWTSYNDERVLKFYSTNAFNNNTIENSQLRRDGLRMIKPNYVFNEIIKRYYKD